MIRYYTLVLGAGVKRDNIILGPCAATVNRGPTDSYLKTVAKETRMGPCCDYALHKGFVIFDDMVYPSYHQFEECDPLCSLDDEIEHLLLQRKKWMLETMPILHDPVCINECHAVGICWGLCSSSRHIFRDSKPSSVCDRAYKEAKLVQIINQEELDRNTWSSEGKKQINCAT
jgi:sulfatase maturation enzyme AslB (radical SAM superfamily)